MNSTKKTVVDGVFGCGEIPVEIKINHADKSGKLYILLHGAYGKVYHHQATKYQILSQLLSKKHSVGFYQTSRRFMQMEKPDLSYDEYRDQSFSGKKFSDEWVDVQRGVKAIIDLYNLEKGTPKEIICVGFSMGGLWSCLLTEQYEVISKIYTFGSGVKFKLPKSFPLFESFPNSSFFADALSKYKGEVYMVRGSEDELTSKRSAFKLFELAEFASIRSYQEWLGVDHQFVYIDNENRENELIKRIMRVLNV